MTSPICFRCLRTKGTCCCEFKQEPFPFCLKCKQTRVTCFCTKRRHLYPHAECRQQQSDTPYVDVEALNDEALNLLKQLVYNGNVKAKEIKVVDTITEDLNMDDM